MIFHQGDEIMPFCFDIIKSRWLGIRFLILFQEIQIDALCILSHFHSFKKYIAFRHAAG